LLTTSALWSFYLNDTLFFASESNLNLLHISKKIIPYFAFWLRLLLFLNLKLNWVAIFIWRSFIIKVVYVFLNSIVMIFFRLINLNIYSGSSACIPCLCYTFLILVCCIKFINQIRNDWLLWFSCSDWSSHIYSLLLLQLLVLNWWQDIVLIICLRYLSSASRTLSSFCHFFLNYIRYLFLLLLKIIVWLIWILLYLIWLFWKINVFIRLYKIVFCWINLSLLSLRTNSLML